MSYITDAHGNKWTSAYVHMAYAEAWEAYINIDGFFDVRPLYLSRHNNPSDLKTYISKCVDGPRGNDVTDVVSLAYIMLGNEAWYAEDGPVVEKEENIKLNTTIADEAVKLVYGDRQASYGPPTQDFARTAKFWSAILGIEVTPKQVALCMVGVKLSREVHKHKDDNLVDLIGYALCAQRIETNT